MVMALGGIVMTKLAVELGLPAPLADRCAASRVTALFGLVNGLLVTRIKLPPFIVTLGTLQHRVRDHAALLGRADRHRPAAGDDLRSATPSRSAAPRSPTARC